MAGLWLAGCGGDASGPPVDAPVGVPVWNGQPMQPVGAQDAEPEAQVLMVRLRLIPVEVPFGTVSQSERLWSYLDEEVVGPESAAVLARNGLRVGRGRVDSWLPVSRLLREMTGQAVGGSYSLAQPGRGVPITLKQRQDGQEIFTFNRRGELEGRSYPPGDNVLMVACHLNPDDLSSVLLHAVPLVRSRREVPRYVRTPGGPMFQSEPQLFSLEALEFKVPVPNGRFLVIGPGARVEREGAPGRQFLMQTRDGLRYETLVVIVPEIYAAPARAGATSR